MKIKTRSSTIARWIGPKGERREIVLDTDKGDGRNGVHATLYERYELVGDNWGIPLSTMTRVLDIQVKPLNQENVDALHTILARKLLPQFATRMVDRWKGWSETAPPVPAGFGDKAESLMSALLDAHGVNYGWADNVAERWLARRARMPGHEGAEVC